MAFKNQSNHPTVSVDPENVPAKFINLSNYLPNPQEQLVLNTSPKFAVSNLSQNVRNIIPKFEQAISQFPTNKQVDARILAHNVLSKSLTKNSHSLHNNFTKTISNLKNNKSINILSADKCNQLVIMNNSDFMTQAYKSIDDLHAIKITKDPTPSILSKLSALKKNKDIPTDVLKSCFPPLYPQTPKLFFQIKTHKKDFPLRPLVARFCSPTFNIEKAITRYLSPFFSDHPYQVESSYQFKSRISQVSLPQNYVFHTMDVIQLFPSIPVQTSKNIILDKLQQIQIPHKTITAIESVLNLILSNIFFTFDNHIFKQTEGAPMGLSLSPILAEAIMQRIEIQTFSILHPPVFYQRYVDDVFLITDPTNNHFQAIFNQANQMFPSIKFTFETSQDNCISFLDMKVHSISNKIELDIYRKNMYTSNIIPFNSNHPLSHKLAFFKSQIHRAIHLPSKPSYVSKELAFIKNVATTNEYPIHFINKIISRTFSNLHLSTNSATTPPQQNHKFISLPFVPALHKPLQRLLRNTEFKITYQSSITIKSIIKSDRQISPASGGVYSIPFADSFHVYIGRTKRSLSSRIKEHQYNLKTANQETALTIFTNDNNIPPIFSDAKIISSPRNLFLLNYSEAVEIYWHRRSAVNHNPAIILDKIWTDLLDKANTTHNYPISFNHAPAVSTEEDN